ncbi:MAG: hypothetical protein IT307_06175 [Chloroflexi bacterium]|nr:hypothetical protein [Chloroflexota bacterium]
MSRRATQVYLTAEQHTALQEVARANGCSMAEMVRTLVERYLLPGGPPPTDLSDLAGAVRIGRPTDVANDRDSKLADAVHGIRRHERLVRLPGRRRSTPP